ncbi:MAG: hypothetical protein QOF55_2467 [Thermoleophilaceae bacterium]|nr:hypothetical protein [Thermoleophilaceae bacterium]
MHSSRRHIDRLGAAMLVGALVGFVAGAMAGLSSSALDAPVLLPFAGAGLGVLVAGVAGGLLGAAGARDRGRREASERALLHARLRDEAHRGWIDGIDLTAEAPPPPGRRARSSD